MLDSKKRPRNIHEELREELIQYVSTEVKKGHFPSRREIERTFKIRLDTYIKNIEELYKKTGYKYKLCANQNLKSTKAKLLLELVIKHLNSFGLELISSRGIQERGIDILAKKGNKKVGIELKAYNKNEKLKLRDIKQTERFIQNERLDEAIIVTTSDKKDKDLSYSKNISILNYTKLNEILNLSENKDILFIRNYSINQEDTSKKIKRQIILDYVSKKYMQERIKPNYKIILKELHLDIYTYFKDLFEIYKILKIPPPLKNMNGKHAKNPDKECIDLWKNEFKKYILEKVKKERIYPSGEQIAKHFGISHIWNIANVSDLYKELNLKSYLERKRKITFVREP